MLKINRYWVKTKTRTYNRKRTYNLTYKGKPTKKRIKKSLNQGKNLAKAVLIAIIIIIAYNIAANSIYFNGAVADNEATTFVELHPREEDFPVASLGEVYREFTAYNAGDPYQTDNTPCISASGDNICTLLAQGQIVFASNEFPIGTKLYVEGIGEGTVLDRMNSRYPKNIDVAMQAHQKKEAIEFGRKTLLVKILN